MKRHLAIGCILASVLAAAGCDSMSTTDKRVLTGGALGGAVVGAATGEWGWAAAGAAAGAVGGYLYDEHKKSERRAYDEGARDARSR